MSTQNYNAVTLAAGQVFEASNGEHLTIVEDDRRGSKPLVVRYDDRDGAEAVMSRYSFVDMARFDGFVLIAEDADTHDEPEETMPGEFVGAAPRCARCNKFMARYYDGEGMPVGVCGGEDCDFALDASELINDGHFEHAGHVEAL